MFDGVNFVLFPGATITRATSIWCLVSFEKILGIAGCSRACLVAKRRQLHPCYASLSLGSE